jgi:hypothetical protein
MHFESIDYVIRLQWALVLWVCRFPRVASREAATKAVVRCCGILVAQPYHRQHTTTTMMLIRADT